MSRKNSDYIFTYSGEAIYPEEVRSDQIHLVDIAYGLGGIIRYNGQTRISVLRHSLALERMFQEPMPALYALLHDAAEAYMMDVPVPKKKYMTPEWHKVYEYFEALILAKYWCNPTDEERELVSVGDKKLVEYEMDSRERFEVGSHFKYPNPRKLKPSDHSFIDMLYDFSTPDDKLIPIYLTRARRLISQVRDNLM